MKLRHCLAFVFASAAIALTSAAARADQVFCNPIVRHVTPATANAARDSTYDILVRSFGSAQITHARLAILEDNREYEMDVPVQGGARLADEDGWLVTQYRPIALHFNTAISMQAVWIESYTDEDGNNTDCLSDPSVPLVPPTNVHAAKVQEQLNDASRANPAAIDVPLQDGIPFITPENCANKYVDADLTRVVSPALLSDRSAEIPSDITVLIRINLKPDGELASAVMQQSTGDLALDKAALTAAQQAHYSPKKVNCIAFAGSYIFRARFDPSK
ncbi:MAG: TonB family protein [Candidatus Eremiobacteraeota bacterium]|nr:TonB family protein [Candidatus Eremiobacteraeota bacterium]